MARLIQKIIILSEVSHLAVQIDSKAQHPSSRRHKAIDDGRTKEWGMAVDVNLLASSGTQGDSFDYSDGFSGYSRSETKKFTATAQMEMMELLEEWEEPELQGTDDEVGYVRNYGEKEPLSIYLTHFDAGNNGCNYSSLPSSIGVH